MTETMITSMQAGYSVVGFMLVTIGEWLMLEKMGEKGWKALIPFYGEYTFFKLVWDKKYFWLNLLAAVVMGTTIQTAILTTGLPHFISLGVLVLSALAAVGFGVMLAYKIAKAFGHGVGYTVGMILAQPIFAMILGLENNEYVRA